MKKIISVLLCLMLCTITAFAENSEKPETVGGKITLTQFLGVSREDAESVAITVNSETNYIDKNTFYDVSDSFILTSSFEPKQMAKEGIYITIKKTDGSFAYAFIDFNGGVDRSGALMSRNPFALYMADDLSKISAISSQGKPQITVNENLDIRVNGQKAEFTLSPFITQEGRTLVPAREICGYLNKNIIWLDSPARISVSSGSDILVCAIGESNYSINGNLYETDAAAQLIDGHAYIPLRTLAEFLGYSISFIPSSNL